MHTTTCRNPRTWCWAEEAGQKSAHCVLPLLEVSTKANQSSEPGADGQLPGAGAAGREEGAGEAPGAFPQPCARPAAPASLEASVGDILVELRTMNSHLDVIARALTKLASSLGPPPQPLPDAPDAN